MSEILLIRHGQTEWNLQGRMQGQQDSPLTPLGLQQARQVARRLRAVPHAALYTSDLGRAHQTARYIADETKQQVVSEPGLRERNFGIFEGLTNAEIEVRHPDLHALFEKRDPHFVMPGGESAAQFHERCLGTLRSIAERHDGESVVVVSHGLVLDALYRAACRMPLQVPRGFPLLNCSISTFRYTAKGWLVVAVCDVQHLACEDMTSASDASVQVPADRASA
jgi:2,3-bisphosphoglycerate-dependent phosphoglycerate mutase